jgi:hypothetical protein
VSYWRDVYKELTEKQKCIKLNLPASQKQIVDAENLLGNKFPADLKTLLSEMDGDGFIIFSIKQIIEINLSIREFDCFMPLDCILFFGGNGCGDYFGYPITSQNEIRDDNIFMWDHEYDNRIWKANSLKEFIIKYYNDEI